MALAKAIRAAGLKFAHLNYNTMRQLLLLLLCLSLQGAFAQKKPAQKQPSPVHTGAVFPAKHQAFTGDSLRIMTWNLENLVDTYDDPYVKNRREDEAQLDSLKMQVIAAVLAQAQADVVIVQEVESANALEALAAEFFPELGYRYFADARSQHWFQNVAIMSRLPLGALYSYRQIHTPVEFEEEGAMVYQSQDYINSRMWACDLLVREDYSLLIMGLHLKAGRKERDQAMRLGQIEFLRGQLAQFHKTYSRPRILVAGDLNATPESAEVLSLLRGGGRAKRLQDALTPEQLSHPADKPSRRLDYLLYNRHLAKDVVPGSAQIFQPFSPQQMRRASDHLPLIISLKLP